MLGKSVLACGFALGIGYTASRFRTTSPTPMAASEDGFSPVQGFKTQFKDEIIGTGNTVSGGHMVTVHGRFFLTRKDSKLRSFF